MNKVVYFHRNIQAGYSINKVTQTIISGFENKVEQFLPFMGASLSVIIKNLIFVYKHREKKAINHVTGDVHYVLMALIGCKSVLTIHDTVPLQFNKINKVKKLIIEWLWYRIPLMIATKVVCISEETKRCVENYTSRKDLVVIHNAVDPVFHKVDKKNNKSIPRILIIGTSPNKNLFRTLESLNGLECELVIIGKPSQNEIVYLRENTFSYIIKTNLSDEQIVKEYADADIVSFISLFEGFGMIIIEANKVGRPVICSHIPVLKEVAGNSALFVDPNDISDIRNGFQRLINDENLQKSLISEGFENVKRFEVDTIRKEWIDLYNTIS